MKVYAIPSGVKAPDFDASFVNGRFDIHAYDADVERFFTELEAALRATGYTGKRTGKLWRAPMADGQAVYMVAERRSSICLIHCPVGDAWHLPEWQTRGLTRADVVRYVDAPRMFGEKR